MANKTKELLLSAESQEPVPGQRRKARRARKDRPSTCRLIKSIYEETDLSKLTPRQRILHQKFHEQRDKVTSFFLVSNNISAQALADATPGEGKKMLEDDSASECAPDLASTGLAREAPHGGEEYDARFLVVTSDLASDSFRSLEADGLLSDDDSVVEAAEVESPFGGLASDDTWDCSGVCRECFEDAVKTYYVLESMGNMHRCGVEKPVMVHKHRIRQSLRRRLCFSRIRHEEVMFAKALAGLGCCSGQG